jgi:CBS domain containing-hemolysin-like protein
MTLLIFYLLLALGVSTLCSLLEAVLLSTSTTYIIALQKEGAKAGDRLMEFKEDVDRPLAAILSLNTVAHTIGAAGVGAQSAIVFGDAYVTITSVVLTILILVISEIIPKTVGARYWRKLAPTAAVVLRGLIVIMWPLVKLSEVITRLLANKESGPTVSREEFSALADIVAQEGIFDEKETTLLRNLMRFGQLQARDIMTPRTVIVGFDETTTVAEILEDEDTMRFSRFVIYDGDLDEVSGYVLKHDILLEYAEGNLSRPMSQMQRELLVMPAMARVADILDKMLQRKEHIILLVGEYGGTAGICTLEDIVETLLGLEIVDEMDAVEDMQALARQQWYKRAHRLGIVPPEDERDEEASKIGAQLAEESDASDMDKSRGL